MSGYYPPGVTDSMIPGNRSEDKEIEVTLILTAGEIEELREFSRSQEDLKYSEQHELAATIANIVEQLEEYDGPEDYPEPE